ncbi:MAG: DUF2835 domain-containing protein [Pseudomonadota bacterium]
MTTRSLDITLAINADDFVRLYQGRAVNVVARASNGQTVQFPAGVLRRHVTRDGVQGRFRLFFDGNGKFVSIERT